jgi:type I restriction enzyme S subunit
MTAPSDIPICIDLSDEELSIVQDVLRRHVPEREVWAFGSRARHTAKKFSDLDLAVIGETPLGLALQAAMNEAFQESALPFKVDLVDWASITPAFRQVIERGRVRLR